MQPQSKPTSYNLLASWIAIWKARISGKTEHLNSAIKTHTSLFPFAHQHEAELRAKELISRHGANHKNLRASIQRAEATLQSL